MTGAEPTIGLEGMKHHDPEPDVAMMAPAERAPAPVLGNGTDLSLSRVQTVETTAGVQ